LEGINALQTVTDALRVKPKEKTPKIVNIIFNNQSYGQAHPYNLTV
jgi:hypothetical protein